MSDWRFHLMNLPSRTWVDRDLQLQDASVSSAVSAPASIRGKLPRGNTSGQQMKEWGSMIIAQDGNRPPVVAIVDSLSTNGDFLMVEAGGFSMYPTGMPWVDGEFSSTSVDPLSVVRMIWIRMQNHAGGDLGVVVDADTSSPVRLGVPESNTRRNARWAVIDAKEREATAKASYDASVKAQTASKVALLAVGKRPSNGTVIYQETAPSGAKRSKLHLWIDKNDGNKAYVWNGKKWVRETSQTQATLNTRLNAWLAAAGVITAAKKVYDQRKKEHTAAKDKLSKVDGGEAEFYTLNWWSTHDMGSIIDELAVSTPFEYREISAWTNSAMDDLTHRLELDSPGLGVRRPDLKFEIGVNVTLAPSLIEDGYASEVIVLGAGEGRAMVRATASGNAGRLRRAVVLNRKEIGKTTSAASVARTEVASRAAEWSFDSLSLREHAMAPYGSFNPGDQILVTGDAGWRQLNDWVRVLEITTNCATGAIELRVEAV